MKKVKFDYQIFDKQDQPLSTTTTHIAEIPNDYEVKIGDRQELHQGPYSVFTEGTYLLVTKVWNAEEEIDKILAWMQDNSSTSVVIYGRKLRDLFAILQGKGEWE